MSLTADGLEARGLPANVPDCRLDDNRSASLRASTMLVKAPCLPTTRTRAASHSQLFVLLLLGDARETGDAINKCSTSCAARTVHSPSGARSVACALPSIHRQARERHDSTAQKPSRGQHVRLISGLAGVPQQWVSGGEMRSAADPRAGWQALAHATPRTHGAVLRHSIVDVVFVLCVFAASSSAAGARAAVATAVPPQQSRVTHEC